mgnify:CR=1 FL=1|jgi:hypothetical protein
MRHLHHLHPEGVVTTRRTTTVAVTVQHPVDWTAQDIARHITHVITTNQASPLVVTETTPDLTHTVADQLEAEYLTTLPND